MSKSLKQIRKNIETSFNALENSQENKKLAQNNLEQVSNKLIRVNDIVSHIPVITDKIDKEFKEKTKLTDCDIAFLMVATALQCARQHIFKNDKFRINAKQGDRLIDNVLSPLPPTWSEVLTQSVPYDATKKGIHISKSTGLSGTTHRYRTLGHDPILGWIFGTANIMTNSLTKYNLESYQVKNMKMIRRYPCGTFGVINDAITNAQKDKLLLPAAVARQAIHFGSDYFTKQGLPIPVIMTLDNDMTKNLIFNGSIDLYSITRGVALATLINMLIEIIHKLFYSEERDGSVAMYGVRTRKILSYSNAIAASSNVVVTAFTQNLTNLDVGGMLVALHRFITDTKFIQSVKYDFIKNELYNMIIGTPYDFMEEK